MKLNYSPWLAALCLCLAGGLAQSQDYFKEGATWHYKTNKFGGATDYNVMQIEKDTVVLGRLAKKLTEYSSSGQVLESRIVAQEGKKILAFNTFDEAFYTLYDFSLGAGESYVLEGYPGNETVSIDSVGTLMLNGQPRNYQMVTYNSVCCSFSGRVIEGIGNTWHFFPIADLTDIVGLRCFNDIETDINFYNEDCKLISSISEADANLRGAFYPNPFTNRLNYTGKVEKLEIRDLNGRLVYQTVQPVTNPVIDLVFLPEGLYVAQVQTGDVIKTFKLHRVGN